ncbi:MAG: transporter-related protein [Deltaproteobacteria bacterium]|nr:transporter-related protein [Deltaproteobacteria bacterium]
MNNITIHVENLSKRFGMFPSPANKLKEILWSFGRNNGKEVWALKNVSFQVRQGETLGIIGRNGSGKSTLLQILCGILRKSSGKVSVIGRISALLELGAGFHAEFSGRDNVYMNGAITGLSHKEMDARFQDIADFSEIGDFMEQPVRTYSSGMFLRLAFACAINMAPDILIVDEALAVGDTHFQRKCNQKIQEFRDSGGSMLFVSHDMDSIRTMCNSAILLEKGTILESGDPARVADYYQDMVV